MKVRKSAEVEQDGEGDVVEKIASKCYSGMYGGLTYTTLSTYENIKHIV